MAMAAELSAVNPRSNDFALCIDNVLVGVFASVSANVWNTPVMTSNSRIFAANSSAVNSWARSTGLLCFKVSALQLFAILRNCPTFCKVFRNRKPIIRNYLPISNGGQFVKSLHRFARF